MSEALLHINTPTVRDTGLANAFYWNARANGGYDKLGWVSARGPLNKMVELAQLTGDETVVDAGTGSGAVLDALAPHLPRGKILGFDISEAMLARRTKPLPANAELFVADIYNTGLPDSSVDLVTVRQVFHNLPDIPRAVRELNRITRTGGRLIVCEYTPRDDEIREFERPIWEMKEPGRHLWTGEELAEEIRAAWSSRWNGEAISLEFGLLAKYSNRDWMRNSGLSQEVQQAILDAYLQAPPAISERMGMVVTEDRDTLIDRPFAFVVARK